MELLLVTNIYIVLVVIWTASFINRSPQKQMKQAAFLMGILLTGWSLLHLIEYRIESNPVISRYIWYSYSAFELTLPLVFLWMAYIVDKPDDKIRVPAWFKVVAALNFANILLNLTNDFHLFVHPLDVNDPNWIQNYSYGIGFYIWQAGWVLPILTSVAIMLTKIGVYVRKRMLLLPILLFLLQFLYQFAFITRVPFIFESNRIMVISFFVMLFIESVTRSGLIPVNTKYRALFTHSPLSMRIIDNSMHTVLCSSSAVWYDYETFNEALGSYPDPAREDENTLLFAAPITGGYALWQEDITALTKLNKEMEDSVNKLTAANMLLAEEEKTKQVIQSEIEKTRLMEQLETEISGFTIRLSTMIENLENNVDKEKATARITLLLCYIKRRCNLFFREKEGDTLPADELTVYFDELAEMAGYSGVRGIVTNEIKKDIPVRHATLYYDLFYNVIYWATWLSKSYILAILGSDNGSNALRLLPSEDARSFRMGRELQNAITNANGTFTLKELDDDAVGLSLSFFADRPLQPEPALEGGESSNV